MEKSSKFVTDCVNIGVDPDMISHQDLQILNYLQSTGRFDSHDFNCLKRGLPLKKTSKASLEVVK